MKPSCATGGREPCFAPREDVHEHQPSSLQPLQRKTCSGTRKSAVSKLVRPTKIPPRDRVGEPNGKAASFEGHPGLIDPALGAGDLSSFLQPRNFSRPPGFLSCRIREISFREIKMDPHEIFNRR